MVNIFPGERAAFGVQIRDLLRRRIDELLFASQLFHARRGNQLRFLEFERSLLSGEPLLLLLQGLDLVTGEQTVGAREQHADQQHSSSYYRSDQLPAGAARLRIGLTHDAGVIEAL